MRKSPSNPSDHLSSDHPSSTSRRFSLFPRPLAKSVEDIVKPVFKQHGFAEHRLLTQWSEVVGPELAAFSVPQKLTFPKGKNEGATLHVLVAAGRAIEMQHMQPVIVSKIATYFGYDAVKRLSFTQASTPLFRKEKKQAQKPKAQPDAALEDMVAGCTDPELRAALLSLGVAALREPS